MSAETLLDMPLPKRVDGEFLLSSSGRSVGEEQAVYFVRRNFRGGKVITSPVSIRYD